jgi:hypothetical protein
MDSPPSTSCSFGPADMSRQEARRLEADMRNAGRERIAEQLERISVQKDLMREPGAGVGVRRR